jgi:cell filamentation protein
MSVSRYDAIEDPYSYRGTNCLKNKAGIRDPELLEAFELEMPALRAQEPLPLGRFGPAHYRRIHRHLFQDVYKWAGVYRTISTSKGGNRFCLPRYIDGHMDKLFGRLTEAALQAGSTSDEFLQPQRTS